jgi:hypothetical protein
MCQYLALPPLPTSQLKLSLIADYVMLGGGNSKNLSQLDSS